MCVSDISMLDLPNIPKSMVIVHADEAVYDVFIPAKRCIGRETICSLLREHLDHYMTFDLNEDYTLKLTLKSGVTKVIFPFKLSQILGLGVVEVERDHVALRPVDPMLFIRRIFVTSSIVAPSIVNGSFAQVIYYGPSNHTVSTPTYFPLALCQVSAIDLTIRDSVLDRIDADFDVINVMFHVRSP